MSDRELLELAAKAAGLSVIGDERDCLLISSDGCRTGYHWNPLTDDGDALRLAVKLHMALTFTVHGDAHAEGTRDEYAFEETQDAQSNARRAIVRVAAELATHTAAQAATDKD